MFVFERAMNEESDRKQESVMWFLAFLIDAGDISCVESLSN